MRNLTIVRKNAVTGSNKPIDFYIEDRENPTITIEDTPCRKMGTVRCDETQVFAIDSEKALVYALDPNPEEGLTGDRTQLPAGDTDLYLTGKIRRKSGHPFYFDGPATNRPPKYHSFASQKGLIIGIALLACFIAPFLLRMMPTPGQSSDATLKQPVKTYEAQGTVISLPDNFQELEIEGYTLSYSTMDAAVYFEKCPLDNPEMPEMAQWDAVRFAQYMAGRNNVDPEHILRNGQIPYYSFETLGSDSNRYYYYVFAYKTEDALWGVRFAVSSKGKDAYEPAIMQWASSVRFPD